MTTAQEIFNYRLSRARMTVEMAFGRLASRFRIFHRPIEVEVQTCDLLITACCVLHNMLTKANNTRSNYNKEINNSELTSNFVSLPMQLHETVRFANEMRENVKKYLISNGDVPFQWQKIRKQVANPISVMIE